MRSRRVFQCCGGPFATMRPANAAGCCVSSRAQRTFRPRRPPRRGPRRSRAAGNRSSSSARSPEGNRMSTAAERFPLRAPHGRVAFAALASLLSVAACGQEQFAAEAEARARRWGIPAAQIVHNVVYAEYGQGRLMLHLYLPPNRPAIARPGVIAVRGGAWQEGDKEFFGYIAGQIAREGFVAASIQYRTAKEAKFPAAVQDVKAAVRWMRAHAAEYGVNPDALRAIGGSAGAHLVAMLATTAGTKALEGDGGNPSVSSDVQA